MHYTFKNKMEWVNSGLTYYMSEPFSTVPELPNAIYTVEFNQHKHRIELKKSLDQFEFPYKIYDLDKTFITRVIKTYHATNKNLGVLLHGIKGTGKTVTTKLICNALQLPVLIVTTPYDDIIDFVNKIPQNVIILIDEFEKVYVNKSDKMLTLMDGVLDSIFRRVFLLTSNTLHISTNLLNRPGRIRYNKKYSDLSLSAIEEIVDDLLNHTQFRQEIIEYVSVLDIITVDIVKTIVSEVNIHESSPGILGDVLNIKSTGSTYNIYKIGPDGTSTEYMKNVAVNLMQNGGFQQNYSYQELCFAANEYIIKSIISKNEAICALYNGESISSEELHLRFIEVPQKHRLFKYYNF